MNTDIFMDFFNEWWPILVAVGGTILTVGGIIFSAYLVVKPKWDWLMNKIDEVKSNTTTDTVKETISNKLQIADMDVKIAELEDKINNPLTSETSRKIYTQSLKIYTEMKIKLDNGIDIIEEKTDKYL